jgi:hypothetical protein
VASNGLIEKVRTNLLLQSETFSNATWSKANTTFSVDTLTANAGTSLKTLNQAQTTQGLQTVYFDVAYVSHSFFQILFGTGATDNQYANFDVQNKVLGTTGGGTISSFIQDFGTYVRIGIVVSTSAKTNVNLAFVDSSSALRAASSASTGSVKVFRSQLEVGDIATDYIATTTAAVSVGPVSGLPRLDYLNSSCPRLLLEGQRTNVITNYNDFVTGASNVTTTANNATSPEGYQNADLITGNAGTSTKVVNFNGASAGQYTISVFAKYNTQQWIQLTAGGVATYANFDIQNGAVGGTNGTSTITDYGNGWYRCSLLLASGTPLSFVVGIVTGSSSVRLSTTASTGSFWAYGFQSELGTYATSIIPTNGTSVTRVADSASKTGISSLIGQTEGTLFVDLSETSEIDIPEITIDDNTNNNRILFTRNLANGFWSIFTASAGVGGVSSGTTTGNSGKFALAYSSAGYVLYRNGVQVATRTAALPVSLSAIRLNGRATSDFFSAKKVAQALLFKTRLSNSDLAAITTL